MSEMSSIAAIAQNPKDDLETLKKISDWVWKDGAILTCPACRFTKELTAAEMTGYLKKWPKCMGTRSIPHKAILVSVRPL